ncbi:hypothetical protein Daus18300_012795 [Diaporthe australafricana]|uniref:IBR domain-containing protein n=1 Tax=Diaporthe australafricana TaxID=127596 RepID=A0ABR3W1L4_9PEZI
MASNDYGAEARERVVDETLELIDNLDVHQARSILRCFAIDDESFDARALETITKTAQKAAENAQKSAQASQASMNVTSPDDHSDEGYYDQQRCATDEALASDPGNPRFEDVDTERFIRGRHVTINHYYMGKGPEAQPQPEPKPAPEPEPNWPYCIRCSDYYVEEDNVMQSDGTYPCGYHTGTCLPQK